MSALKATSRGPIFRAMLRLTRDDRALPLLAGVAAMATIPGAVLEWTSHVPLHTGPLTHFALVATAALAAAVASAMISIAGIRRNDGPTVLLGMAFSTMTALLAVHGLATPGILVGGNGVVRFAGAASLPAGALILALSALPALRRPHRIAALAWAQVAVGVAIVALGLSALALPSLVPPLPATGSPAAYSVLVTGCGLLTLIAVRAIRTWRLTRRARDLVSAAGIAWLAMALVAQMTVASSSMGFYVGHLLELAGVMAIGIPAVLDLRTSAASRPLVGDLGATDQVLQEEAFLGARVRALLVRLAEKDTATEDHTRRVAMLAVRVGESLGLAPGRLRALAVGGLLHDIGKLSVPTAVLQKPAALDDEEFAEIRKHPAAGVRLLQELGGFPAATLRLVGDHHERLDGSGCPQGLSADQLDLETRILAVCDVYDALVSDRVYREAWSPERALLKDEAGTRMDAKCVAALEALVSAPFVAGLAESAPARPVALLLRPQAAWSDRSAPGGVSQAGHVGAAERS